MKSLSIFLFCFFGIISVDISAQIITRKILTDTVQLWVNAEFYTVDDYKKVVEEENERRTRNSIPPRNFEDRRFNYNWNGEIVVSYNNLFITTQKETDENNLSKYFISLEFWVKSLNERVSTIIEISEMNKIINFLKNNDNISNLQNEDIVSFGNFQIVKYSTGQFYIAIKDARYGKKMAELMNNKNRNEFALLLSKLENSKSKLEQDKKKK